MAIKYESEWIQEEAGIARYFIQQFEELFKSSNPIITEELTELEAKVVIEEESSDLAKIPSPEEIKKSIWQLHLLQSPGPDGFPRIFYRFYWNIIQDKIIRWVQYYFQ